MKTRIKNDRKKALFGIDDAIILGIGLASTIANVGTSIYNTKKQTEAKQAELDAQNAAQIKSSNIQNDAAFQQGIINSITQNNNPNKKIISTQTSQLKLGGKRCKKVGGKTSFTSKCI